VLSETYNNPIELMVGWWRHAMSITPRKENIEPILRQLENVKSLYRLSGIHLRLGMLLSFLFSSSVSDMQHNPTPTLLLLPVYPRQIRLTAGAKLNQEINKKGIS
jgi:hypothetical protein